MKCEVCGNELRPGAKFCPGCGTPVKKQENEAYQPGGRSQGSTAYQPVKKAENAAYQPAKRQESAAYQPGGKAKESAAYQPGSRSQGSAAYQPGGRSQGGAAYQPGTRAQEIELYQPDGGEQDLDLYQPEQHTAHKSGKKSGKRPHQEEPQGYNKVVRDYFLSQKVWPLVMIMLGIPMIFAMGIGIIMIIIGVIGLLRTSGYHGEEEVDAVTDREIDRMKAHGLKKLNLIDAQVSLIEPLVVAGFGASPDGSFAAARAAQMNEKKGGLFSLIFKRAGKSVKGKVKVGVPDPVVAERIGSDDYVRTLLLEVTVFYFTEMQLLIYTGDVDISTGVIYQESTHEYFYEDINGIVVSEEMYKIYHPKKKQFLNRFRQYLTVHCSGCSLSAAVSSAEGQKVSEAQFMAMRSLIREKKNRGR